MSARHPRHLSLLFRAATVALLLALGEIAALTVAPGWHEVLHGHSHDEAASHHHDDSPPAGNDCAVSVLAAGGWLASLPGTSTLARVELRPEATITEPTITLSFYRFSGVLEHAPPRRA